MKKLFITSATCLLTSYILFAQNYCGSSRYDTVVFSNVTIDSTVVYGSNTNINNQTEILKLNVYQPTGDTAAIRPLIILAHGGSFMGGDKRDMSYICMEMAKRGYVAVSINYRLGIGFPIDSIHAMRAVWRATQDMKASVRFFRKDAATTNSYKIDPNMIFIGGASAGAIMAVHYAYLDQPAEIPSTIDTTIVGGLEGASGNSGYSSDVKAIINICGAIADTCWMKPGDKNMVSLQGNNDNTVPYCSDFVYLISFKIMIIHGLGTMVQRANHIGLYNPVHTFYGQDHGSPGDTINIDTTIVLASDFLYKQMGCIPSNTVDYTNSPLCLTNLPNTPACILNAGTNDIVLTNEKVFLYPNPASENLTLTLLETKGRNFFGEILDITGRKINEFNFNSDNYLIMRNGIQSGIYLLKLKTDAGESFTTKIIFTD
ncbi:MAG: carboxylesterase family protein [Bacteroidetes bacterium]|nr:carboxylesterase family protein [Bacteroidota bacterium]